MSGAMSAYEFLAQPQVLGPVCALVGGLAGHLAAPWLKRAERAPDMQQSVNSAVEAAVKLYTATLTRAEASIAALSAEVAALKIEVADLNQHISDLTETLDKHNIPPPPRRKRTREE